MQFLLIYKIIKIEISLHFDKVELLIPFIKYIGILSNCNFDDNKDKIKGEIVKLQKELN